MGTDLGDMKMLETSWQATLTNGCPENADLPFEPNSNLHRMFQEDTRANLTASIACLAAMRSWTIETLARHNHIALLGV